MTIEFQRINDPAFEQFLATITPDLAKELLEHHNPHNRLIKSIKVASFMRDMISGHWKPKTGESLKFTREDDIVDGQHRLIACALSGVPFTTAVTYGVDMEVQDVIDSGTPRSLADMLTTRGVENSHQVASAARLLRGYLNSGGEKIDHYMRKNLTTKGEALDLLESYPELVTYAASTKWTKAIRLNPSVGAVAQYLTFSVDPEAAKEFFSSLVNHTTSGPGDPRTALLRRLALAQTNVRTTGRNTLSQGEQLSMVIRAWNAWRRGEQVTRLKTNTTGFHIPVPKPI